MKRIADFFRKEKMMCMALILALISLFISPLSGERIMNLSWKTLASLFLLFVSLEGLKKERIFNPLEKLLGRIRSTFALSLSLMIIIFAASAIITNDVALLTFVPITIAMLKKSEKEKFLPSLIVLETIAANLGSMLTPFGNPQNLFLYGKMDESASAFMLELLPLWLLSLVLLILALIFIFRHDMSNRIYIRKDSEEAYGERSLKVLYACLFLLTLATILGAFEIFPILITITAIVAVFDRKTLLKVDWPLLLTFLCFFIFSSSISSNERIAGEISKISAGHEFASGLIFSQIISNVPTAILIEPFAANLKGLLFGVDIGGLGTPVASLASLISIRLFFKEEIDRKHFMKTFFLWNIAFLFFLIPLALILL